MRDTNQVSCLELLRPTEVPRRDTFQPVELPGRVGVPECAIQGSEPLENKRTKTWCILTLSAWIRLRAV